jgi:Sugar-transfer associated ATP-grasp
VSLAQNLGSVFFSEELKPYLRSKDKKPFLRQLSEMVHMGFAQRYLPYQYIKHGLYKTDAPENYLDYLPPRLLVKVVERVNSEEHADRTRNKARFRTILEQHGLPCVREIARRYADGRLVDAEGQDFSEISAREEMMRHGPKVFIKETCGMQGKGAKILDLSADRTDIFAQPGDLLYQPVIRQHPQLARLYPYAVNTIRTDTLESNGTYINNGAVLRMGCGVNHVDNWDAGGLIVGIDLESGRLYGRGKRKAKFGGLEFDAHPDTGVTLAGVQIPYWQDLLSVVRKAAAVMAPLGSLGWDVAVTPNGPVIIEANHVWDVFLLQQGVGGLAKTKLGEMAV